MASINDNYLKLKAGYLFPEIARRVKAFSEAIPEADVIKMGIGDVVKGLAPSIVEEGGKALREMASDAGFHGYGPENGYAFLREAIVENEFKPRGVEISADEIFVSDGSKCDTGNIQEIFSPDCKVAVSDPVYPVYVDTNVMAGRSGENKDGRYEGLVYLECKAEDNFAPPLPDQHVDLIYLCSPNNPTGTVMSREQMKQWVDYAKKESAIILFDAAYEGFITESDKPHSIYEVEGAREVAIEFRSYSKTAGFTGVRCAFTVVPKELSGTASDGSKVSLHALWSRRQSTKFNGTSYPVQRMAAAAYTESGKKEIDALIRLYLSNAAKMRDSLKDCGLTVYGGINAPYVWVKTPDNLGSWELFDRILNEAHVVTTPGAGFGNAGEGYIRFSAFAQPDKVEEAMKRIRGILKK